jgi:outer membrane protein
MLRINLLIIGLFVLLNRIHAQETWNLERCIGYALEHNIDINRSTHQLDNQKINVTESKARLLPSLNAGSDLAMNFGRNIDGNTNEVTFDQTLGNNYWVQTSLNLFQGLVNYNTMVYNSYLLVAMEQSTEHEKNQLIIKVISAYYAYIYTHGLWQVAVNQTTLAEQLYQRMQKLVGVGKESPVTLQELKSNWASDKHNSTLARNNAEKSLLELKQLIRMKASDTFTIENNDETPLVINPIPDVDSLFNVAVQRMPQIRYQENMVRAAQKDLAVAKGSISPQLYLSAGLYSDYFDANRPDEITPAFSTQIRNNQSQQLRIGISIPVFNGASTYSKIKRKQIVISDQNLQLEKQKETLYAEVWNLVNNLESAYNEYLSSHEWNNYSQVALEQVTHKMEKGLASVTDFQIAKQQAAMAEAGLLKARLLYQMQIKLLGFYETGGWEPVNL